MDVIWRQRIRRWIVIVGCEGRRRCRTAIPPPQLRGDRGVGWGGGGGRGERGRPVAAGQGCHGEGAGGGTRSTGQELPAPQRERAHTSLTLMIKCTLHQVDFGRSLTAAFHHHLDCP